MTDLSPEDKAEAAWQRLEELEALLQLRDQRIARLVAVVQAVQYEYHVAEEWWYMTADAPGQATAAVTATLDALQPGDLD